MTGRKCGRYFKYLHRVENEPLAKIPRQTECNRKKKVFYKVNGKNATHNSAIVYFVIYHLTFFRFILFQSRYVG